MWTRVFASYKRQPLRTIASFGAAAAVTATGATAVASCVASKRTSDLNNDTLGDRVEWLRRLVLSLVSGDRAQSIVHRSVWVKNVAFCDARPAAVPSRRSDLPDFDERDVAKHNSMESGVWVTFGDGVYDITEFIEQHPGGDRVLDGAGGPVEPFWEFYQQHHTEFVYELLEEYRIGNFKPSKNYKPAANANAPSTENGDVSYANDPPRDPALVVRSVAPFTAETPAARLASELITPAPLHYVRNHFPVPKVDDASAFKMSVSIEGAVDSSGDDDVAADAAAAPSFAAALTVDDLRRLPKVDVTAAVQCAGNRRNEMAANRKVRGGSWESGAISNAVWSGARLADVLRLVLPPSVIPPYEVADESAFRHVHFRGADRGPDGTHYEASIPLVDALNPRGDVIIAYEMNGEELPPDHGYPLRVVVPGVVGARSVKWVDSVRVARDESESRWQRRDYKSMGPNVDWDNVQWDSAPPVYEYPVQCAIVEAKRDAKSNVVHVRGYAASGGGRGIQRVDLSPDGGETWLQAKLDPEAMKQPRNRAWGWTPWRATIAADQLQVPQSSSPTAFKQELVARAVDTQGNTQPENMDSIWNLRGVNATAWSRLPVNKIK